MTINEVYLTRPAEAVRKYLRSITKKEDEEGTKYRAEISSLRNSINRNVDQDVKLFQTVTRILTAGNYSEKNYHFVTDNEEAVGAALTLFASHYGTKVRHPYNENRVFGSAIARIQFDLRREQPDNSLIINRLNSILRSNSIQEYRRHIKSILNFASNEDTSFDYSVFTQDLIDIQNPEKKDMILRKWTRDFYQNLEILETEQYKKKFNK